MFAFIIEGSCIALYSAPKSLELFYLLKVVRKTVADDDKIDIYDHTIQNGLQYIGYLYVYPGEIFCPAVPTIKDGLYMTVQEYQFLCDLILILLAYLSSHIKILRWIKKFQSLFSHSNFSYLFL